jgi:hypothetical protein
MSSSSQRAARAAGLLTGLALAALLVFAMRVPASGQPLGAGVRMEVLRPGELDLGAKPVLLSAQGLQPGDEVRGSVPVRNITVGAVIVRMRAMGAGPELGDVLHVELRADGRRLANGPLSRLRRVRRGFRIERTETSTLRARAWIPSRANDFEGRSARVSLKLRTELVEGSRR